MKNLLVLRHSIFLFFIVSSMALLQSCAVNKPYSFTPITVPDIVKMSNDKMSSQSIINEIKKSRAAYSMKASEYAKLKKAGVSDSVVNFMQETQLNMIRRDQQAEDSYYYSPYYGGYWYGPGFGWPYPFGYWGWGFGSTIIFRGGGGHYGGHEFHGGGRGHDGGGHLR